MTDQPAGEALLPCIHCGGTDLNEYSHHWFEDGDHHSRQVVQCLGCMSEATKSVWNRRPAAPAPAALRERLFSIRADLKDAKHSGMLNCSETARDDIYERYDALCEVALAATSGDEQAKPLSFYDGVNACMAVIAAFDQPTIARDIVNTIDRKKLLAASDHHDRSNLKKLGIIK